MYAIPSSLTSQVQDYDQAKSTLLTHGFGLGGNWDYDHGSFDCALDNENMVWLRLPFDVTVGNIDSERDENQATIRFGQPFVLKHIYNEGSDHEAQPRALGAMLDQFSDPVNPDAKLEKHWTQLASQKLKIVEQVFQA